MVYRCGYGYGNLRSLINYMIMVIRYDIVKDGRDIQATEGFEGSDNVVTPIHGKTLIILCQYKV